MRRCMGLGMCAVLAACGGGPPVEYRFSDAVNACETLEWSTARAELLESGDTAQANQYASGRCFMVEPARPVTIVDEQGGFFQGDDRFVLVETTDGEPLEHHAGAEFREAVGQPARTSGWVRLSDLIELP